MTEIDYDYPDEAEPDGSETPEPAPGGPLGASPDPSHYQIPGAGILRGDAAAAYLRMRAAGMPAGGVAVFSRTYAQQAELRRRYEAGLGPIAARPNRNAPHIKGVAMDLHTSGAGGYAPSSAHLWLTKGGNGKDRPAPGETLQAHAFGWRRTVPSERWHFGYDPARDKHRTADLASRLKRLGYKNLAAFQTAKGLKADGTDGPVTWVKLLHDSSRA